MHIPLVETGFLSKSYIFEYVSHNHCSIACIAIECMEDVDDHSVQTLGHVAIPFFISRNCEANYFRLNKANRLCFFLSLPLISLNVTITPQSCVCQSHTG